MKLIYVGVPIVYPLPFTRRYALHSDLEVVWEYKGEQKKLIIDKGYITDGASIPKALWSIMGSPYLPEYITAAIVHDRMWELDWEVEEMSDLFKLILKDSNVSESTSELMRTAVYVYKKIT